MRYVFCKSHKVDRLLLIQFENLFEKAILMCPMVVSLRYRFWLLGPMFQGQRQFSVFFGVDLTISCVHVIALASYGFSTDLQGCFIRTS